MTFIIDLVIATISGGLVIITIIWSMFNVQASAYNIQVMLSLNKSVAGLNGVVDVIDHYLADAGKDLEAGTVVFLEATPQRMRFLLKENYTDDDDAIVQLSIGMRTYPDGHRLEVRRGVGTDVVDTLSVINIIYDTQPLTFRSRDIFEYFDKNKAPLVAPFGMGEVYGCSVSFEPQMRGWYRDDQPVRYPITFWRYFKNIYAKDLIQ